MMMDQVNSSSAIVTNIGSSTMLIPIKNIVKGVFRTMSHDHDGTILQK